MNKKMITNLNDLYDYIDTGLRQIIEKTLKYQDMNPIYILGLISAQATSMRVDLDRVRKETTQYE